MRKHAKHRRFWDDGVKLALTMWALFTLYSLTLVLITREFVLWSVGV